MINADKPYLWKKDIEESVDCFNAWFLDCAPKAYRDARASATACVAECLKMTGDLADINAELLKQSPGILSTLRMATCPPIARDRLIGLAQVNGNLVGRMERGELPLRMSSQDLQVNLERIASTITRILDTDIFPWLADGKAASARQRYRASTIVADRLCGSVADPIIRNSQEQRQLAYIRQYLEMKGYRLSPPMSGQTVKSMQPGTFAFRYPVHVKGGVQVPVDVIIQPQTAPTDSVPVLVEAKSAGDFTNVNKRRKEEAKKMSQLREAFGDNVRYVLFLCGYFGSPYLGYEAAEGIDWIWEHRIEDMGQLGI